MKGISLPPWVLAPAESEPSGSSWAQPSPQTSSISSFPSKFEIAKTKGGYASAPTTLVSVTGVGGNQAYGILVGDAAGDLVGTTEEGGQFGAEAWETRIAVEIVGLDLDGAARLTAAAEDSSCRS